MSVGEKPSFLVRRADHEAHPGSKITGRRRFLVIFRRGSTALEEALPS